MATIFTSSRIETRPNWAEISISALRHNFHVLQQHLGTQVTICAVVKCNAYGHGVEECAPALEQAGATWFGVTSTDEGVVLRDCGITARILVMCGLYPGEEEEALRYSLTPAIFRLEQAEALAGAVTRLKLQHSAAIHLKVDTGMARLGLPLAELESFAQGIKRLPQVELEGVFSHLASSEVLDDENTARQIERYDAALCTLAAHGLHPRQRHLANSGAVQARPHTWHNFVRPGLLLYGYEYPISGHDRAHVADVLSLPLRPVLSWKTHVLELRNVAAGQALGYGGAYVAAAPARIAVVSVGYGDGLSRKVSIHAGQPLGPCEVDGRVGRGEVLVRGRRAPIVGRVSMDLTLLDVTDIPGAAIGDEVVLIGRSGNERITAWDLARSSDTVVYETLCNLSKRVPRRHAE
ncbi:MAG TPA: alanine racemase [Terriglobales bacterium]|nr:alanine racemase [Terriglobales bacterium]